MTQYAFGEYPIHIAPEADGYEVDPEETGLAEPCGINTFFPAEQLDVMRARALAHGYVLVIEEPIPTTATVEQV